MSANFAVANAGNNGPKRIGVILNEAVAGFSGPIWLVGSNAECLPFTFRGYAFIVNYESSRIEIWYSGTSSFGAASASRVAMANCIAANCGRGSGTINYHNIALTRSGGAIAFRFSRNPGGFEAETSVSVSFAAGSAYYVGTAACGMTQTLPTAQANLFEFTSSRNNACMCRPY